MINNSKGIGLKELFILFSILIIYKIKFYIFSYYIESDSTKKLWTLLPKN